MAVKKRSIWRRWLKRIGWVSLLLISIILSGFTISNALLRPSDAVDQLTDADKACVAEALHLRREIGNTIWAGLSDAKIPVILYNETYAFLVDLEDPAPGWRTVPRNNQRGGVWEAIPNDLFEGKKYYRQRLPIDGTTPQAFTVRIGEIWVASMTSRDWTMIKMGNEIRDYFPSVLKPFVPYRLAAKIFVGLALNTDAYICAIGHESFHAFQGIVVAQRLADAENSLTRDGRRYPWDDPGFSERWKSELNILREALMAKNQQHTIELCRMFISERRERRLSNHFDISLVNLEREREWEEGLAKFTELALWSHASSDPQYYPIPAIMNAPDFDGYKNFTARWKQELATLRLQSNQGDGRFYYSGMAQAFLLERLSPQWKTQVLNEGGFLEDLLAEAVGLPVTERKE